MRPFDPALLRTVPAARRPIAALTVLGVLQGVTAVATAFALAGLVVAVATGMPWVRPAAWLMGVFVVRSTLAWLGERVAATAGVRVGTALREQLLAAWLARPAERRPDPAAAVTLAAQGTDSVEPWVARYLPTLVAAAVVPPLVVAVLVVVDWPSAAVVALTVPLLPVFAALIGATTRDATQQRWLALSALSGHFLDVVRGLPTLSAYGRARRQVATIEDISQRHRTATMRTLRLAFLSSAALELLATLSVAIVAVTVGIRLAHGSLDLGTGLVAILLAPEAYWPIRRVGAEFHNAADGAQALAEVQSELAEPASPPSPGRGAGSAPVPPAGRIVARGVGYRHPGATGDVLAAVDLDLGPGLVVLTGPSGSGKTTLLELLAGLRVPTTGTIETPTARLVTQRPFLTAEPVRDNLLLGGDPGRVPDERVWEVLREVGLDGVVAGLPSGLDTPLGDDGFGLSAGQRARLALARALLSPPPVLLFDEPTAHLDTASAEVVHAVLTRVAAERVVVAATHRPELVSRADIHLELDRGRVRTGVRT